MKGARLTETEDPFRVLEFKVQSLGLLVKAKWNHHSPGHYLQWALVRDVSFKSCYGGCYTELEVEKTVVKRGGRMYSGPDNKLVILLPRENPYHTLLQYASPSLKRTISAYKSIWNCAKVYDFFFGILCKYTFLSSLNLFPSVLFKNTRQNIFLIKKKWNKHVITCINY